MRPLLPALLLLAAAPATAQMHGGGRGRGAQTPDQPAPDQRPAGAERATIYVEPVGMMIAAFDADGDGKTTRAELTAGVERSFRAIDTSGSGRLGYIEFADWAERFLGDRNALPSPFAVDRNGDNIVTLVELQTAIAHEFDRFDANHDSIVTRAELLTIRDAPGGGGERRGGRGGGGHGGRGNRGSGGWAADPGGDRASPGIGKGRFGGGSNAAVLGGLRAVGGKRAVDPGSRPQAGRGDQPRRG